MHARTHAPVGDRGPAGEERGGALQEGHGGQRLGVGLAGLFGCVYVGVGPGWVWCFACTGVVNARAQRGRTYIHPTSTARSMHAIIHHHPIDRSIVRTHIPAGRAPHTPSACAAAAGTAGDRTAPRPRHARRWQLLGMTSSIGSPPPGPLGRLTGAAADGTAGGPAGGASVPAAYSVGWTR